MPYMLMMIEPVGQRATRTLEEGKAAYDSMLGFAADLQARGLLMSAESLQSTDRATRIAVREGHTQVLDGPFAEAKEMVGGFFLLNTEDRELAIELAKQCPAAQWLTVEVRGVGPCFA